MISKFSINPVLIEKTKKQFYFISDRLNNVKYIITLPGVLGFWGFGVLLITVGMLI